MNELPPFIQVILGVATIAITSVFVLFVTGSIAIWYDEKGGKEWIYRTKKKLWHRRSTGHFPAYGTFRYWNGEFFTETTQWGCKRCPPKK